CRQKYLELAVLIGTAAIHVARSRTPLFAVARKRDDGVVLRDVAARVGDNAVHTAQLCRQFDFKPGDVFVRLELDAGVDDLHAIEADRLDTRVRERTRRVHPDVRPAWWHAHFKCPVVVHAGRSSACQRLWHQRRGEQLNHAEVWVARLWRGRDDTAADFRGLDADDAQVVDVFAGDRNIHL